ncbi:hypothetical protein [Priestia megaterium]|uniref:hypothetical protein n=1 Tax=Priestia megaterium TaxID=1404 RepID=UPI00285CCB93|nr:hypothetical protein [Priestia megaterium]MDR7242952.1 hypothetical protein [Priestia megaterium]
MILKSKYGSLVTPLSISVQDFAFRGRPLEATKHMKPTFTITIKKSERFIVRIFLQLKYVCPSLFLTEDLIE